MPVDRRKCRRQFQLAAEHRQPGKDSKPRINGAEQKKRPEAVGQQDRAAIIAQTRNSTHRISTPPPAPGSCVNECSKARLRQIALGSFVRFISPINVTPSSSLASFV